MNARDITIIYICGHEHSGSTILDLHLQQHEQIVSVGEASQLHRYAGDAGATAAGNDESHCRCGAVFAQCPFWSKVAKEAERLGRQLGSIRFSSVDAEYGAACEVFYRAVARATRCTTIVDSSKGLRRLAKLQSDTSLRVIPIHVTRDLYGYLASHKKRVNIGHREVARLSLKYLVQNRRIRRQIRGTAHIALRFEDFVADRQAILRMIARAAGLAPTWPGENGVQAAPVHNLGGNELLAGPRERLSSRRAEPSVRILPPLSDSLLRLLSRTVDALGRGATRVG